MSGARLELGKQRRGAMQRAYVSLRATSSGMHEGLVCRQDVHAICGRVPRTKKTKASGRHHPCAFFLLPCFATGVKVWRGFHGQEMTHNHACSCYRPSAVTTFFQRYGLHHWWLDADEPGGGTNNGSYVACVLLATP